jgi:hypothetical protein
MSLQHLQLSLDLGVALGQLGADEVERIQRLLECEQVLGAPVALQAFGDLLVAGVDARVLHRRQYLAITLAGHDGTQDFLAGLAHHVGDDIGELDVHLRECLLHVLHMAALASKQHAALAPQRAQHADGVGGSKCAAEQAIGHELLQPLAVQHVGLAARDVLDVAGVDQHDGEAARFQKLEQRDPVHAGRLHRHRVHTTGREPIGQRIEIRRKARKLAYRLLVAVGRDGAEVRGAADIDACSIGVGDGEGGSGLGRFEGKFAIALHHGLLHHCGWNVVPHRVRRHAHSLKRDIGAAAVNRRADSPMSMTQPRTTLTRGQFAPLLHRSSAAPHSTLPQFRRRVFLRRDLRQRADYFANPT